MSPDDKAQLLFWGILTFLFLIAFRRWASKKPSPNTMEWQGSEAERLLEIQHFAAYRSRDVTYSDYEFQGMDVTDGAA